MSESGGDPETASAGQDPQGDEAALDLTEERVPAREDTPPAIAPYDPSRDRERYRGRVAGILLGVLAFIVLGAFVSFWFNWASQAEVEGLLTIVFAPVVGLVGAATGFYFGAATAGGSRQETG